MKGKTVDGGRVSDPCLPQSQVSVIDSMMVVAVLCDIVFTI